MVNNMSMTWGQTNIEVDKRAERLAKVALGWDDMTTEQKMDNTSVLIDRMQQIKESL